jgi:4-amino-4-deoxy-L-arabinose transferase-like glycosyltransferase
VIIFVGLDAKPTYDGIGYNLLANALLEGQGYVDELGNPTAFRPPIYPLFLAGVYTLTEHSIAAIRLIQAVLDAFTVVFVYFVARVLFGQRVALLAGLGTAFHPLLIYETGDFYPETLSFFLQFSATWCLVAMLRRDHVLVAFVAGILMGLTVLARPTATLWVPLILGWVILPGLLSRSMRRLLGICLGLALVFGPWTIRNYAILDAFIPVSSGGMVGLWSGNNPLSQGGSVLPGPQTWNGDDYPGRGWYGWEGASEVESSQRFAQKALQWIRENPRQFALLIPKKLLRLWSPVSYGVQFSRHAPPLLVCLVLPPYLVFLGFAFHGIMLSRRQWKQKFPLLAIIISVNVFAVIYYGATRYGIPMGVVLVIFTAVSIDHSLGKYLFTGGKLC